MGARKKYQEEKKSAPTTQEPLVREYVEVGHSEKARRRQEKKELSFFLNLSVYSVLFFALFPAFSAFLPEFIAFIIALVLPLGVIFGGRKLIHGLRKKNELKKEMYLLNRKLKREEDFNNNFNSLEESSNSDFYPEEEFDSYYDYDMTSEYDYYEEDESYKENYK